jgi:hypothetical protein
MWLYGLVSEMRVSHVVSSARPDNRPSKSHGETRLEVDAVSMEREVGDHKLARSDFADDSVVDVVVVLDAVDTHDREGAILHYGRSDAFIVRAVQACIEGHCDEAGAWCPTPIRAVSVPTFQSQRQAVAVDFEQLLLEK